MFRLRQFHTSSLSAIASIIFLTLLNTKIYPITAGYVFAPNSLTDAPSAPTSSLASKVIFQSPSMANYYKDLIVSSKPLTLRKPGSHSKQKKKTKKDSKIYYIPMPPMPYRYIPGVGYDYQPIKIQPIIKEQPLQQQQPASHKASSKPHTQHKKIPSHEAAGHTKRKQQSGEHLTVGGESKMYRMQRGNYYFNGLPVRLQVAHAQPKYQLTPQNLKSKFYFNKKIIY